MKQSAEAITTLSARSSRLGCQLERRARRLWRGEVQGR